LPYDPATRRLFGVPVLMVALAGVARPHREHRQRR